jgi:hypothetical protein
MRRYNIVPSSNIVAGLFVSVGVGRDLRID